MAAHARAANPNVVGDVQTMTVMTPIKPGWSIWLVAVFWLLRTIPYFNRALEQLSFIHFAHWDIIRRIPNVGQPAENLRYDYLLFETNFNGSFVQYIEAFSEILGNRLTWIWGSSYGYPGPVPLNPFLAYIDRNWLPASYYWMAYPDAPTTVVVAALDLRQRFDAFATRARALPPAELKASYEAFLTEVQGLV